MKAEIIPVWSTLQYYADEKNDATAIGLLRMIRTKQFVRCLYLLGEALPHLAVLSLIFRRSFALRAHHDITATVQEGHRRYADSADSLLNSSNRLA